MKETWDCKDEDEIAKNCAEECIKAGQFDDCFNRKAYLKIKAILEKEEILMKPIGDKNSIPRCGACGGIMDLMQGELNYCPNCGHKIDWGKRKSSSTKLQKSVKIIREILFRGFRENPFGKTTICLNGQNIKGEWVYGLVDKSFITGEYSIHSIVNGNNYTIISETLSQYTGLIDKNGNRMVELAQTVARVKWFFHFSENGNESVNIRGRDVE